MSAPIDGPAPAPAANAGGPIDDKDVNHWKGQFNKVLSNPSETINSRSAVEASSWTKGFFACFSPADLCLITCCLPCITFGKTHHRVQHNGNMEGYESINTSCLLFCASSYCGLHWIPAAMQRSEIREKYNLQGSCFGDLVKSCCCACCSLIQMEKETEHREELLRNGNQQQYKANEGMVYPPAPAQAQAPAN